MPKPKDKVKFKKLTRYGWIAKETLKLYEDRLYGLHLMTIYFQRPKPIVFKAGIRQTMIRIKVEV